LTIQLVDLFFASIFRRYSDKYNIYRELYEHDLLGLEIREINYKLAKKIRKIILNNREICYSTEKDSFENCDLLALGSYGTFKELTREIISIGNEDLGFKISQTIQNITGYNSRKIIIAEKSFSLDSAYSFGILNVTPDSFSDGGKYYSKDAAVEHALKLIEEGADIIDVGGESSRPGSERITEEEELSRVIPVIDAIKKQAPNSIISIDTMKSNVAKNAIEVGASIVNDISAAMFDEKILDVVKNYNVTYVLMHMQGTPDTMQVKPSYDDVVSHIYDFLLYKVEKLKKHGIKNIIIDPGIGFGKQISDNYEIIKRLNELKGIGQPIMIGVSRKSFLGKSLNLGIDRREDATLIAETLSIKNGARFIRTHNVKKTKCAGNLMKYFNNPELLINV
jgi:dihydropteroate synthase